MPGQTTVQRHAVAGKHVAPTVAAPGVVAWGRLSDGVDLTCTFAELANIINLLSQQVPVTQQAGATYTPVAADVGTMIEFTGAGGHVMSMPTDAAQPGIVLQNVIGFTQIGSGAVSLPPGIVPGTPTVVAGVTYDVPAGFTITRFVPYNWRKRAANEWILG